MIQWLKLLATLAKDPVQFPALSQLTEGSRGSDALFWPPRTLHACGAQITQAGKTSTRIKVNH